ncbi:Hypothetical protein NTJ_14577 [Nesidiocoris tenuis]|uniref:Uncharacterized protein n=1 Tax=Nesidiocoris tenuis TaxID=355587 RepID=A0ABN7BDL8_9HEMI|nr:Hypothetical protein NTJ_14577 [Nesidiocoris tenuis]
MARKVVQCARRTFAAPAANMTKPFRPADFQPDPPNTPRRVTCGEQAPCPLERAARNLCQPGPRRPSRSVSLYLAARPIRRRCPTREKETAVRSSAERTESAGGRAAARQRGETAVIFAQPSGIFARRMSGARLSVMAAISANSANGNRAAHSIYKF